MGYLLTHLVPELGNILPTALLALAAAVAAYRPLVRKLDTSPLIAIGLLLSAAAIAIVTLTRPPYAVGGPPDGASFCLHAGWQPTWAPWPLAGRLSGRSLNVWMFVPVGMFCALTGAAPPAGRPVSRWTPLTVTAVAALAPLCIEATQRMLPLDRLCDTRDVADNTYGLLIGALLGLVVRQLLLRTTRPRAREPVSVG